MCQKQRKKPIFSTLFSVYTSKYSTVFPKSEIMIHSHIQQMSHTNPYILQIHGFQVEIRELLRLEKISKVIKSNHYLFILYMYLLICNHYGKYFHLLTLCLLNHFVAYIRQMQIRRGWSRMKVLCWEFFTCPLDITQCDNKETTTNTSKQIKKPTKISKNNHRRKGISTTFVCKDRKPGILWWRDNLDPISFYVRLLMTFKLLNFS